MQQTIICHGCDERLTATTESMRHHATLMHDAIEEAKAGTLTEESYNYYRERLYATFDDAQLAWDDYRSHLIEHGLIPASRSRDAA